ncbi:MAG: ribonuclease E/G, partial [Pseudomonadota bacterium]
MDVLIEELGGSLWAAALEDLHLNGLEIDSPYEEVRWGSIYWARVKTVDKALDAVFLDLEGDNTGILYNKDVRTIIKSGPDKGKVKKGGDTAIGKTLKAGQMICVQAKSSYLLNTDRPQNFEDKIPRMSMDITMPGRYLIFCPMMEKNRLSLRIKDKEMRKQLIKMLNQLEDINGCILRAAAAHVQTDVLIREGRILKEAWDQIQQYLEGDEANLIMLGPDAVQRTLSDHADTHIDR